ncbi:phenylpropionate dioxygenase-like ring-hydroxylating dioxygenase large terminal subunit [Paenalcaligenes hominis]|uniref:Phenylpropionate dioxygenase-like ring-hydroxylating dioxygenase large terminal subunit n=1 Tax=Paenalcaligenes hominis TaxID=643674 RepID=A0ABX0WSL0_9BURK|nr:aromatic ring-hydroxylating dioxygenase subunit alpha [Paenalcaligenes hominis]NJB65761.1 phenylpropionate dioxygenase-like ring-hydroxylating dioxygenase large terminal subunit [Paenalcaligenes hominis]GGE69488.1 ring-hydroxylating oxygenase subunit alpha [Paenalcaligenes hominis]
MMSQEQNDFITRVGPTEPAGKLLRQYWQPIALSDEIAGVHQVKAIRVLGQDFVLFKQEDGRLGLLDKHCPHRGADLSYGRIEDGGIRCPFHGWLFDAKGNCLETPAEPEGSQLCTRIQQGAYPVVEKSGIVFGYFGEGDAPAFPHLDCFVAPDTHVFAFKGLIECNWLQALEVGIDPAHASYLHRFFEDEADETSYGKQFRSTSADSDLPVTKVLREYDRPDLHVEESEVGMRLTAVRELSNNQRHVRITNMVFPQAIVIPMSSTMTISQWHVPVDDHNCYWYAIFTSFTDPVDKEQMRAQRLELYELPDYISRRNRSNNYGFDPVEQQKSTYLGMGHDINVHDQWAVESLGSIQDRTKEHLGTTDKGIILYRRILIRAIKACLDGQMDALPMRHDSHAAQSITGPIAIDGVTASHIPEDYLVHADQERRRSSSWAASVGNN